MDIYLLDWANLLLRWLHVITAIAWIGSSFYFVFLDNNLIKPTSPDLLEKGVDGAMWAVHGGGFYNPQKYMVAPKKIHTHLHWFYWESYSTWLSGFALFTVLYLFNAGTYLIDKSVYDWAPATAIAAALGFLVAFWLIYDTICRVFGFRDKGDAIVGGLVFLVIALAAWAATQLFAGRAAFLLVGAMIATAMSANVFFWIIPGQRKVVAAMTSGLAVDPASLAIHGKRGKQRSVHNTYFTLPVLFAMLSNHYSFLYTHRQNWAILVVMMLAGALIRQYFVMRHGHKLGRNGNPVGYAVVGGGLILATLVALAPAPQTPSARAGSAQAEAVTYAQVREVFAQRCYTCHGETTQMKNIRLDRAETLKVNAQAVYQQAVVTRQMPMNNATGITDDERALLARWYQGGAPVQ
ncbi:MAG TPA: urate hydroxylase PuuD [Burkholderiaceae bacterium]|nr:urate hydroxylase PuuD [Burkholderiaceae bacterium]